VGNLNPTGEDDLLVGLGAAYKLGQLYFGVGYGNLHGGSL
jgi:hypothetical protein